MAEEIQELYERRDSCKLQLSRLSAKLKRLVVEQDISGTRDLLQNMKSIFDETEHLHYQIEDMLNEQAALEQENKWYADVTKTYLDVVKAGKKMLRDSDYETSVNVPQIQQVRSAASLDSQSSVSSELAAALTLPKMKVPIFSGSPADYNTFMNTFDEVIGTKVSCDKAKLMHLSTVLQGPALQAIKPMLASGDASAYMEAKAVLKERFGNVYVVSQSILGSLRSGRRVHRASELRQLSDELQEARNALVPLGHAHEANSQSFMRDVMDRCPTHVKNKWHKRAIEHKDVHGSYPMFEHMCNFISREAERACDPVYGEQVTRVKSNSIQTQEGRIRPVSQVRHCWMCGANHGITDCPTFKAKSPVDRGAVAREARLCFKCLNRGHYVYECRSNMQCTVPGCRRGHHPMLHLPRQPVSERTTPVEAGAVGEVSQNRVRSSACSGGSHGERVCLPVVPVRVGEEVVWCLLDTGSSQSLISKELVDKMGVSGSPMACEIETVGGRTSVMSQQVSIEVSAVETGVNVVLDDMLVVSNIPAEVPPRVVDIDMYPHLADVPLYSANDRVSVHILIGLDKPELLMPLDIRCNPQNRTQPYACKTKLGWSLQGPVSSANVGRTCVNFVGMRELDQNIEQLWRIERSADNEEDIGNSIEDRQVEALWKESICVVDGNYQLPVPWKEGHPKFPNNRYMAERRLQGTLSKVQRANEAQEYQEGIQSMIDNGYAEKVPKEQLKGEFGKVWYLPHHGVRHPVKKKLRIVFDCAAKQGGLSFNDACLSGPDLVNRLTNVLLRFRLYEVAYSADVKAMYMMVKLPPQDQDCLRFLWPEQGEIQEYRITRHVFGGIFGAASSTFALRHTLQDHECSKEASEAVQKGMYVDDLLDSKPTVERSASTAQEVREVLAKGGFTLTKFLANRQEALSSIPEEHRAGEDKVITEQSQCRVLGVKWRVKQDVFQYEPVESSKDKVTRRSMLSEVASMFDPLGLIGPIVLKGRMIFQEATKLRLGWDDEVPSSIVDKWRQWLQSLEELPKVVFPRCFIPTDMLDGVIQFHHFGDASRTAYGMCSYIRISKGNETRVVLVAAKSKVAPLKEVTIPRLELAAAVLLVKQDMIMRRELCMLQAESYFWSDSQAVLAYITNDRRRFKTYVANRVAFIREHTNVNQWRYVNTRDNPADVASRGCAAKEMPKEWIDGPSFLYESGNVWPDNKHELINRHLPEEVVVSAVQCSPQVDAMQGLNKLVSRYSSFYDLKKAVVWLKKLWKWYLAGRRLEVKHIDSNMMKDAETSIVRCLQGAAYADEREQLKGTRKVRPSSSIVSLNPALMEGVIRVRGRLAQSTIADQAKYPILLPPKHQVTSMILREVHCQGHLGVEWTAAKVREKYWVPQLRSHLKEIKRKCVVCKKLYGVPIGQKMADLPTDRVSAVSRAFLISAVDCMGPILVRQGRAMVKRYGCVFTCMTTRAVHLEVLASLDTDSFINALARFIARRGTPRKMYSDNGRNFVGARGELRREIWSVDTGQVQREARKREIEWVFSTPLAPHAGGVWERMVRTVKRVMLAVLTTHGVLTDEVLNTVFCEVESLLNSRPLTKVSEDPNDFKALTPNHFLILDGSLPWPWANASGAEFGRRRWRKVQALLKCVWERWVKEYLPELQRRQKWHSEKRALETGELVLVVNEMTPRGDWPLAIVQEVVPGRDGLIRSAKVRTKSTVLLRPITKLVRLELDA